MAVRENHRTAFNFGKRADRLQMYIGSTLHAASVVRREHIDVFLSNHVSWDDSIEKLAALKQRRAGQPHPYVIGQANVERVLNIAGGCAAATLASFDAAAIPALLESK